MRGKTIFVFLLGVAVGGTAAFYYAHKKLLEAVEAESVKLKEYYAIPEEESSSEEPPKDIPEVKDEEPIKEVGEPLLADIVLKNDTEIEGAEKPSLFDYAKISLSKKQKNTTPVEESSEKPDEGFKMRRVEVTEYEDLAYSYEVKDYTVYQDGYVTDINDAKVMMLEEMYPDATLGDADKFGMIYVADDHTMTVYALTVDVRRYEDLYDIDEEDEQD